VQARRLCWFCPPRKRLAGSPSPTLLERQQVAAYTTLIRELGDRDPTTRRLLLEILAETERHASELAEYLQSTSEVRA
jgi:hypothetical protein